jgi:hypothetical protein
MQATLISRHRVVTDADLIVMRRLIAQNPGSSRLGVCA